MRWIDKLLGVADRMRGASIPHQEWEAVDGVTDTGRLLRAIAGAVPSGAVLNIMNPRGAELTAFLRARALPTSRPQSGDYCLLLDAGTVGELAAIVDRMRPEMSCSGVFVAQGGLNIVEAYRRDAGEDVVWVSTELPDAAMTALRRGLERPIGDRPAAKRATPTYGSAQERVPKTA